MATAALVASVIWKNTAMNRMKIAGGSPTPNQTIANGIHAIGDSDRKKLIQGISDSRVAAERPITRPSGTAASTPAVKPHATR